MMLGMGCSVMVSLGITLIKNIPGESSSGKILSLGESGLIVSQSEVTRILLHHPNDIGPQVIAIPDDPLIYQEIPTSISHKEQEVPHVFGLPSTPLRNDAFYFLSSLLWDFDFAAVQFDTRFKEGFMLFIMYIFSLIFLLSSLRFIMDISSWPLANLFLGLLAFRGVLALERFLNSPETLHFLTSSLGDQFPIIIISPLVFCILGISIILYTFFIHLRRDRRTDENY
jgi:hypothetical protein